MYYHNGELDLDDDDQCGSCYYLIGENKCPLLAALVQNFVFLSDPATIDNCGMYKEHERHLRVVR